MQKKYKFIILFTNILILVFISSVAGQNITVLPSSEEMRKSDDQEIKVNTLLVSIPVIVGNRNGLNVAGLTKKDFTIEQDGQNQPIEFFATEEAPINVAILIDTSNSAYAYGILNGIKKAGHDFLQILRPEDKAMVVSFDGKYEILSALTSDHTNLEAAIDKAEMVQLEGYSMYDAIYDVIQNKFANVKGRKAVILLTDGGEFGSHISIEQLQSLLTESDTVIYPILFKSDLPSNITFLKPVQLPDGKVVSAKEYTKIYKEQEKTRAQIISSFATATGGTFYTNKSNNFKKTFQTIADELKKQYLIGFYPSNIDDGNQHKITVRVNAKNTIVRTKQIIKLKKVD